VTVTEVGDAAPNIERGGAKTVASMARDWAKSAPDQIAMRAKNFGIWDEYSWADTWDLIETSAHALISLGIETNDRVSIHCEDRPEWIILDLATVAIRGTTVGLYPTNPAAEVSYMLNDSGAKVHLAEDQEQVDKVFESEVDLPALARILYIEPRGLNDADDDRLLDWPSFLQMGRDHRDANPTAVSDRMAAATPDDVMTFVYTSGTTGPPKGAMLTNKNSLFCVDMIVNGEDRLPGKDPNPKDQILTYLPLCHVAERIFSTWTMVGAGPVLNFAESVDLVNENLREVQPTIFFGVPRIWEKLHAGITIRAGDASPLKKLLLLSGLRAGKFIGKQKVANGGDHTAASRIMAAIFFPLVFRPLLDRVGLRRVRYAASGAAPIAPDVLEFFIGLGVPIYELYGMTENSAIATTNFVGRMKLGTVGEAYPGIGLRIDEETGEIQTKHDGNFAGYWNRPEATTEAMTDDGWLKTGDVGEWVDGTHVKVVDRIKHIIITAGGKNISPSEIENSLKTSPFVNEAMVIGDRRKYLTALIGIELETVGNWALRQNLPYTTYRDLTEKPEVIAMIDEIVAESNKKLARVENIRKFRLIPKELDHEDGELTATQKLKRNAMEDTFRDLIEEMYA
jgi:long-chain acyl-CoA synthetase